MTDWLLLSGLFHLISFALILFLWTKYNSLTSDEGRLKHGLQILNAKISVLEDLSNRVDEQAASVNQVIENKYQKLEKLLIRIEKANELAGERISMLEAHPEELAEREQVVIMTRAALMANRGIQPSVIAKKTGLGIQEAELIYTLNKDRLQFSTETLPPWLKRRLAKELEQSEFIL